MELSGDLAPEEVVRALPERPVRVYPAMLSTESEALAWARAGAEAGSVVVAGYQAAPRGRAGLIWHMDPATDLGFSIVLRPQLSVEREGWIYTLVTTALAGVYGEDAVIEWPDEIRVDGGPVAAVGIQTGLGPRAVTWGVATVLLARAEPPRARTLARAVEALHQSAASPADDVLAEHRARCATLGRRVSARLIPMGPNGLRVTGTAVTTLKDGALVIEMDDERRVAVRPQSLGLLEGA